MVWYIKKFPENGRGAHPIRTSPGIDPKGERTERFYAGGRYPKKKPCR